MISSKAFKPTILCAVLLLAAGLATSPTVADDPTSSMMIFPTSPYFTDAIRSEHLNVVNNSETSATFRVGLIYEKQGADGVPVHLDAAPDANFDLAKMLIYSPRQVFLQPGDTQTIKLALRRPENMPEGEQRIYLKLTRMDGNAGGSRVNAGGDGKAMLGRIAMQVGYAIPIVVRHGKSDAAAKLGEFRLVAPAKGSQTQSLSLVIRRTGKFSTMGRLSVFWTPPGKAEKVLAKAGNINVFPENDQRAVSVRLTENPSGGTIRVLYDGGEDTPDNGTVFDEKSFPVAG